MVFAGPIPTADRVLLKMRRRVKMVALRGAARGAVAGLAATVPMTVAMQALRARLPQEQARSIPPREVIDRSVDKTGEGDRVDDGQRNALTSVGHFAFGAAAGALYGATVGSKRSSALGGIAYGLAVWALAYGVGLPSLGLHPAATDDTKDRNEVLIASHVVWGAALGHLTRQGHPRARDARG
jgi:uncharacterized membrane protein YagU involved in acid resistance